LSSQPSQAQILINCPQCGGDIGFLEDSREIRCEFCGTTLLIAGREGVLRYALPLKLESAAEARALARQYLQDLGKPAAEPGEAFLFYAPFWRLQGQVYRWVFGAKPMKVETEEGVPPPLEKMKTLLTRIMDHTLPGFENLDIGLGSLGIRSQALQLRPFQAGQEGAPEPLLPLEVPLAKAQKEADRVADIFFDAEDLHSEVDLQSFVGKIFSVVYFPVWFVECGLPSGRMTVLVDALGRKPLRSLPDGSAISARLKKKETGAGEEFGRLQFIPLKCPNCGWDFSLQPSTFLPFCMTCRRLWRIQDTRLVEMDYLSVSAPPGRRTEEPVWVPFWRCRAALESGGVRLTTMADLYRLAPPPRVVDPQKESRRPIYFYVPAVRFSNPQAIHNLGSRLSFLQPDLQSEPFADGSNPAAAGGSLSAQDAADLGAVILGSMVPQSNRKARTWLKGCKIELKDPQIHYFPFARADLFWKELNTGIAFQHNAFPGDLPPARG
jgi:ribosomal protein S27E